MTAKKGGNHPPSSHSAPFETRRYLGLDLAGARAARTSLAALEYYPREQKIFLLELQTGIGAEKRQPGDEELLKFLDEYMPGAHRVGIYAPTSLPPCIACTRKTCPMPARCSVPSVKWMRETLRRSASERAGRDVTPYTQRPAEVWLRHQVFPKLNARLRFEIDEALGGTRAPITARMHFLRLHLDRKKVLEVLPKLTLAVLAERHGIPPRLMRQYRSLEVGAPARVGILEHLARERGVFIYERDMQLLSQSLAAFDAFFAAYTALLADSGQCAKPPKNFPRGEGWIEYPES
ncbi:MAG: DUF429 domain-containing protein [Bdellovibrionales bacterium]|nr:DUF429 domain-containing protein [Bdellovibrionales bacterium]